MVTLSSVLVYRLILGDTHDRFKMSLESLLYEARVPTEVEVYGRFAHLIPSMATNTDESLHYY